MARKNYAAGSHDRKNVAVALIIVYFYLAYDVVISYILLKFLLRYCC